MKKQLFFFFFLLNSYCFSQLPVFFEKGNNNLFIDICNCNDTNFLISSFTNIDKTNHGLIVYRLNNNGVLIDSIAIPSEEQLGYTGPIKLICNGTSIDVLYNIVSFESPYSTMFDRITLRSNDLSVISQQSHTVDSLIEYVRCIKTKNNNYLFSDSLFLNANQYPHSFFIELSENNEVVNQWCDSSNSHLNGLFEDKMSNQGYFSFMMTENLQNSPLIFNIVKFDSTFIPTDTFASWNFDKYINLIYLNNKYYLAGSYNKHYIELFKNYRGYGMARVDSNCTTLQEFFPYSESSNTFQYYDSGVLNSIAVSSDSNYFYLGGIHNYPYNLTDTSKIYIHKLDTNLNEIWVKSFGGDTNNVLLNVCQAADGGCFLVSIKGDGDTRISSVIKLDADGNVILTIESILLNEKPIISPNPFTDFILLNKKGQGIANVEIFDIQGRKVYTEKFVSKQIRIPTEDLPKGIYLVVLHEWNLSYSYKIIKE